MPRCEQALSTDTSAPCFNANASSSVKVSACFRPSVHVKKCSKCVSSSSVTGNCGKTNTHNGLLYFHTEIKNRSNIPFDVDYITWKIVDKKVAKRTAVQEQIILPLRAQNYATLVPGKKSERTVFTMAKFTIPDDKCLVVELNEKNGGRHQSFVIENEDLVRANTINELQVR